MSSTLPSGPARLLKTASFKLAATFSILFTLIGVLILGLTHRLLADSLEGRDREAIAEKFSDLERTALNSTIEQLQEEMRFDKKRGKTGPFFVRLLSKNGGLVFLQQGQINAKRLDNLPDNVRERFRPPRNMAGYPITCAPCRTATISTTSRSM